MKNEPEALAETEPEALARNDDSTIESQPGESASASGSQEFAVYAARGQV